MSQEKTTILTFLDLVDICDSVHLRRDASGIYDPGYNLERLVPLYLADQPQSPAIGLLRPIIVTQLLSENQRSRERGESEVWKLRLEPSDFAVSYHGIPGPSASFADWLDTPSRTSVMKELCERWRDTSLFENVCGPKKWRAELYPVYADPFGPHDHPSLASQEENLNFVFEMERSACALFGVITYGVHMSIYDEVVDNEGERQLRVWVPQRALSKPTFPGMLDNTVAGGIPSGLPAFESLVKECMEEASLEASVVHKHTRTVGSISYFYRSTLGWLQPEIEYVYDIVIPSDVDLDLNLFTPKPMDGEVESFEFVPHTKLLAQLSAGLFKPNCGLVIIDLLIRRGYITPENEPNYMKIITRLHGNFDYDKW